MRWLRLLPLVVACSHPKPAPALVANAPVLPPAPAPTPAPAPPPKAPPRLFTEAEISAFEANVIAELDANQKRTCPGPNGTQPGPAAPELAAILDGTGPLASCLARIGAAGKNATLKPDLDAKKPEVVLIDTECTDKIAAGFHRVASFKDGCSPFQLGVRPEPANLMAPIQIAHLLNFHAGIAKDPAAALGMVLDGLRAFQDLKRGHVTLISAMVSIASSEIIGARADTILETAKLSKAQLDTLAKQLDELIAGSPTFHEIVVGERESQELFFGMSMLAPKDWAPHGGWNEEMRMHENPTPGKRIADPRDENMAVSLAAIKNADARDRACPATANLEQCRVGFEALANQPAPSQPDVDELWKQGLTDEPGMRLKLRQQIIDILASVASPNFAAYVAKEVRSLSRLGELRMHVEQLRTHKCDKIALSALAPAGLGAPLALSIDKKVVSVQVDKDAWTFHCR